MPTTLTRKIGKKNKGSGLVLRKLAIQDGAQNKGICTKKASLTNAARCFVMKIVCSVLKKWSFFLNGNCARQSSKPRFKDSKMARKVLLEFSTLHERISGHLIV